MEEKEIVETEAETTTEETTPETVETTTEESDESENIDYKAELERLQEGKEKPSELEKARRALFHNAERLKELGGDPEEIIAPKKKPKADEEPDVHSVVQQEFRKERVRGMVESEDEYKLVMFYIETNGLSEEDAYLLANKGKIKRATDEAKRANVSFGRPGNTQRVIQDIVPERSPEEQAVLTRRGLSFNPKTKTWQGKYSEEYYDKSVNKWVARKLKR